MNATTPRVGDSITTAAQLDALPVGSVVLHDSDVDPPGIAVMQRSVHTGAWYLAAAVQHVEPPLPVTVLYVPGEPSRPSVTDNARAAAEKRYRWGNPRVAQNAFVDGYEAGWAAARAETTTATDEDALCAALIAEYGGNEDEWRAMGSLRRVISAAGRAETTAATDEDAALVISHDAASAAIEASEFLGEVTKVEVQTLLDNLATPLATARTRPTREQVIATLAQHDPENTFGNAGDWYYESQADAVLALLADQPTEAEAGARALEQAAELARDDDEAEHVVFHKGDIARWLRERAARLRGGDPR